MASSDVEICNIALTRIGHQTISSLATGSSSPKAATLCALHYPLCRDAVLRAHPWNFAIRRATLAQSSTTPNHEYLYQHALPTDCLKVIRTEWEANGFVGTAVYGFPGVHGMAMDSAPYRIEGRFVLTNEGTVKIEYIARVEDVAQFDDLFVDVLAQRLAAELCMPLKESTSTTQALWQVYGQKLSEARTADAQEGTPRAVVDLSPWIAARF